MKRKILYKIHGVDPMFDDQETARKYLESRRWPNGARCQKCFSLANITPRKGGYFRCNECSVDFTVRTRTILERSHVPLHKWMEAIYLHVRFEISSIQLAKKIGITQKSAWMLIQKLAKWVHEDDKSTLRRSIGRRNFRNMLIDVALRAR